jgi:hypothetical protein
MNQTPSFLPGNPNASAMIQPRFVGRIVRTSARLLRVALDVSLVAVRVTRSGDSNDIDIEGYICKNASLMLIASLCNEHGDEAVALITSCGEFRFVGVTQGTYELEIGRARMRLQVDGTCGSTRRYSWHIMACDCVFA